MSIFEIHGYNTDDGVLGFIAIPTFMFLDLMWDISFLFRRLRRVPRCGNNIGLESISGKGRDTSACFGEDVDPLIGI